jgi:hypothetical protein
MEPIGLDDLSSLVMDTHCFQGVKRGQITTLTHSQDRSLDRSRSPANIDAP